MKLKSLIFPIIIFLIGVISTILGVLFKILHWELGPINGASLLAIGSIVEIIAVISLVFILLRYYLKKRK